MKKIPDLFEINATNGFKPKPLSRVRSDKFIPPFISPKAMTSVPDSQVLYYFNWRHRSG
jgi:hypothetical protein